LTSDSFLARQAELAPSLARDLVTEIVGYPMPSVAAIITGVDTTGPHLFAVENGHLSCNDTVGFCAIGAGQNHANSVLMSAKYNPRMLIADSLLLTYTAKKRSEVAPGVGAETDMFLLGPGLGTYGPISDDVLEKLGSMYDDWIQRERAAFHRAKLNAKKYLDEIANAAPAQEQAVADVPPATGAGEDLGAASANEGDVPPLASAG